MNLKIVSIYRGTIYQEVITYNYDFQKNNKLYKGL